MTQTLYYVHDPMCSWCWGFKPTLATLESRLPASLPIRRLLGGLAPDSDQPMPPDMQHMLQQTWQRIQTSIPGTRFNFDFWSNNQPRRSTWPACRAIIAARAQNEAFEKPMIDRIQQAYYLEARNPSNSDTLICLAGEIGCDTSRFSEQLHSQQTRNAHQQEMQLSQRMGVQGYPSLMHLSTDGLLNSIPVDYTNPDRMLDQIEHLNHG